MSLLKFVKAKEKVVHDSGVWSDKKMPKSGGKFPLSKARSFRVGAPGWRWRVLQITADQRLYKILVMHHAAKENYVAIVGTPVGSDLLVLGSLENHSTHPGWHVHAACKTPGSSVSGRLRYEEMRRTCSGANTNTTLPFPVSDVAALEIACRYFRLPPLADDTPPQLDINYSSGALQ